MSTRSVLAAIAAIVCLGSLVGSTSAAPVGARPSMAAGTASGLVPARNAASPLAPAVANLVWHGGAVIHSTTVVPVFWGSSWSGSTFRGDKITGLDYLYSHVGGTPYLHTNFEYTDGSGHVGFGVSKGHRPERLDGHAAQ
jgi:hypothetical protein